MRYWLASMAKDRPTHSLPHSGIERQRSINNVWSCKSGNSKAIWSFLSIIKVLAAFIGNKDSDTLHATTWKWASTDRQQFLGFHHGQSTGDVSVIVYIRFFDHFSRLNHSSTPSCIMVDEVRCYCLGGCRGIFACLSARRGCQFLCNRELQSFAT